MNRDFFSKVLKYSLNLGFFLSISFADDTSIYSTTVTSETDLPAWFFITGLENVTVDFGNIESNTKDKNFTVSNICIYSNRSQSNYTVMVEGDFKNNQDPAQFLPYTLWWYPVTSSNEPKPLNVNTLGGHATSPQFKVAKKRQCDEHGVNKSASYIFNISAVSLNGATAGSYTGLIKISISQS